ncbi:DUF1003 domain-containing protein [Leucobacter luti]|uniref:Uncharacterized protein DUF1003 n=1 Tax=Leucobacter luti TaxID=340320 RepID=A0A4Q7TU90_9MICO|nr:DUF1003 domain-containing protein [Leucobacter luti]RZT64504.1 uncharacterized protein DUF1003 [Leucobacter luti]
MSLFRRNNTGLDSPLAMGSRAPRRAGGDGPRVSGSERFGRWTEGIARGMGTPWFLLFLTFFCIAWLAFNTVGPEELRFDSAALGFTALTLILSLQASYAAPMILLAQNRQDDRDRVQIEQDRQRAERALADTEFLAREVVALRLAMKDLPDRDFLRAELRSLLAELESSAPDPELPPTPELTHTPELTRSSGSAPAAEPAPAPRQSRRAPHAPPGSAAGNTNAPDSVEAHEAIRTEEDDRA